MDNKTDYSKPLIVQDDAARDAPQIFLDKFKEVMGITVHEFKVNSVKEEHDEGYVHEWVQEKDGFQYRLNFDAGDPYYKFYKTPIA